MKHECYAVGLPCFGGEILLCIWQIKKDDSDRNSTGCLNKIKIAIAGYVFVEHGDT